MLLNFLKQIRFLVATLVVLLVVVMLSLFEPEGSSSLAFRRQLIEQGQWWRLYTANWVHFGGYHVAMNVLGLGAIYYFLFWRRHDVAWWIVLALVPWCVGGGLYLFNPELDEYRGFSAAAYGALMTGLILEWRYSRLIMSIAVLGLIGKIIYEQFPGYDVNYLRDQIGVEVAIDAHLWGALGGSLLGVICLTWELARDAAGRKEADN